MIVVPSLSMVYRVNLKSAEMEKGVLYAGDFNYLYYGIPYTLNYQVSEEATLTTITDGEGKAINLFEREMIALRATMDLGLMIANDKAFAKLAPVTDEDEIEEVAEP